MAPSCTDCGGTVIEYDHAAGNGFCVQCGTVVEENTIVNEISFGEASTGAAIVQGSFVGHGATHARITGPYGSRGSSESREQTIANASKKIQSIANVLRLSEVVCLAATRLYTLAVEHKFTKGRKSLNVVAVCLYVACRQKETRNYMLIDFSDLLQVNVFELGHTYLQLVQTLNLRLPLVDPSHYISRFSALLEFGDETHKVATDAVRLVQRFDRDWMTRGRRPAGICGAALLLAARMNNFRRSVEEIVQVVKIADTTLKKRLDEFRNTPSGALTLADFRSVWLEEEMDPPAFTKGRQKEEAEKALLAEGGSAESGSGQQVYEGGKTKGKNKKRKGKRKRGVEEEEEEAEMEQQHQQTAVVEPIRLHAGMINDSILAGSIDPSAFDSNIDPALLNLSFPSSSTLASTSTTSIPHPPPLGPTLTTTDPLLLSSLSALPPPDPIDESLSTALAEEVETFLTNEQGTQLLEALDEAEERRLARMREARAVAEANAAARAAMTRGLQSGDGGLNPNPNPDTRPDDRPPVDLPTADTTSTAALPTDPPQSSTQLQPQLQPPTLSISLDGLDELTGLDEDELDRMLLTPDEVRIKERVWVELNKDYLEALAAKNEAMDGLGGAGGGSGGRRKRRKTATKPRDSTTAAGDTPAESVRNLIKKNPKYSKRINYDALKDLFVENGGLPIGGPSSSGGGAGSGTFYEADEKDDDVELFLIDDKDDDEFGSGAFGSGGASSAGGRAGNAPEGSNQQRRRVQVIMEEEPATLKPPRSSTSMSTTSAKGTKKKGVLGMSLDGDPDAEGSEDEEEEDEDGDVGMGWEDAYEQEI